MDYFSSITYNLTDVGKFLQEKSKFEAWQWARDAKASKKGIWIIDRNDNFTKNGVEYVILYEVYLFKTNEPPPTEEDTY